MIEMPKTIEDVGGPDSYRNEYYLDGGCAPDNNYYG